MSDEWKPIESAPKDGTAILAATWSEDWGGQFMQIVDWDCWHDTWGWAVTDGVLYQPQVFTHWQSLPSPPSQEGTSNG